MTYSFDIWTKNSSFLLLTFWFSIKCKGYYCPFLVIVNYSRICQACMMLPRVWLARELRSSLDIFRWVDLPLYNANMRTNWPIPLTCGQKIHVFFHWQLGSPLSTYYNKGIFDFFTNTFIDWDKNILFFLKWQMVFL